MGHKHHFVGDRWPMRCMVCLYWDVHKTVIDYKTEITDKEGKVWKVRVKCLSIGRCSVCRELLFTVDTDKQIHKVYDELRGVPHVY